MITLLVHRRRRGPGWGHARAIPRTQPVDEATMARRRATEARNRAMAASQTPQPDASTQIERPAERHIFAPARTAAVASCSYTEASRTREVFSIEAVQRRMAERRRAAGLDY